MRRHLSPLLPALLGLCLAACAEHAPLEAPPRPPPPVTPASIGAPAAVTRFPVTAQRPVTNEYHGDRIVDAYQWLEAADDPEVRRWILEQNGRTKAYFDAIPGYGTVRAEVARILRATSADWRALRNVGGRLFALTIRPSRPQPFLVVMRSADDPASERVLVDPGTIAPERHTTIDWYVPSPDGKRVAVSLSQDGTENGTVRLVDVETGKETGEIVTYASSGTAGGSLAWAPDSKAFYYTRHPHPGERPAEDMGFFQQVYLHKLGTNESEDRYVTGKDFPRIAEIELEASDDGRFLLVSVQNGDGGEYWQYLVDSKGRSKRFADLGDKIVQATFGPGNKLYLLSRKDAPRGKILRLDPARPDLAKAETLIAESDGAIESYWTFGARLYVVDLVGGPSRVRIFNRNGKALGEVPIPPVSSVRQLVRLGDDMMLRVQSYTAPPAWYVYRARGGKLTPTALAMSAPVSFEDAEVTREACTSKDGTKVPITILRRKDAPRDGSSPALLTGYGGYGISRQPRMDPTVRVWLDRGGVLAVANLRGGGEFGEAWHLQGNLTKKQNVFDDFYACARLLVDSGITRPERLGIEGRSNGGLLMGAALTQHPEMYKAAVAFVGFYDMLRFERSTNGAFNVTEFGTVKDPEQYRALRAYSPYHNVKDGVAYPSVLFMTSSNDPRVDPYHSRKMTARLQAATNGGIVLLRAAEGTGHGSGTTLDEEIEETAAMYAFLVHELRMPEPPAKRP